MADTQYTFGGRLRPKKEGPTSWENLVDLPNEQMAFVYQRLSSHEQVKKSIYSIKAQDALRDLAMEDGYPESMIHVEDRDLGISGTKGREERPGLAYLIQQVEVGLVESVYVVHMSRLYRDQTLINALSLGELFKEYGIIIVTPQMRLNLRDKMHMRLYRMEVERAADELELMANRLLGARDLKAKSGGYAGEMLPPGYIVDEREDLLSGEPNPGHHTYQVYEPHAQVVRVIFEQMVLPGVTPIRVVRFCKRENIVFPSFPSELDTPANRKTFANSKRNPDGSWPVTIDRVRGIATNPAYIGWKVWAGELIAQGINPPIVDEETFWLVQDKFGTESRPKMSYDPLPLAGLLHCGIHDIPRKMTYANREPTRHSLYRCCDHDSRDYCQNITAHHLDDPISDAFIEMVTLPEVADDVLDEMTAEYEQARTQAASYRREKKRLEGEVDSLRANLAAGVMSADQLQWIDEQIRQRLARVKELADLESQPVGAAVGRPLPGKEAIETVRELLQTLGETWDEKPNGLKNALLRLLLEQVIIWSEPAKIRVRLIWRFGPPRELVIYRPREGKRVRWTERELAIVKEHYETASIDELADMLPGRTWEGIREAGRRLGLSRATKKGGRGHRGKDRPYTPEEDELIHRYYAGKIGIDEVKSTGRTIIGIRARAGKLGLTRQTPQVIWEWIDDDDHISQEERLPMPVLPVCRFRAGTLGLGA